MNDKVQKLIDKVNGGLMSRRDIDVLRTNAIKKGGAEELVAVCDTALMSMPQPTKGKKRSALEIVEQRDGYAIAKSAIYGDGRLLNPRLADIASELAGNGLVTDIVILQTEVRFYYRGRHLLSGCNAAGNEFYITCLDSDKITESTINKWMEIGKITGGRYFEGTYVAVKLDNLEKIHVALECIVFS